MLWIGKDKFMDDYPDDVINPLIYQSYKFDYEFLKKYNLHINYPKYINTIGRYNAEDYLITKDYINQGNILDFGAGYGRQINLFHQLYGNLKYTSIEGIQQPYYMQYYYYKETDMELHEYLDGDVEIKGTGIFHIPTWRYDLLPENSYDIVFCVQVLKEINEKLLRHMIHTFDKSLKKGGVIYIRDHGMKWKYPANRVDVDKTLEDIGYKLEFTNEDKLHGVPRIWRKC
jgi:SAM-dependent methyltransferase